MSQAVGTICPGFDSGASTGTWMPHKGTPTLPVNGPWLNGSYHHIRNSPWFTYGKFSNIGAPGPAMLWVLVDEDVTKLNDAAFSFQMERARWLDLPGTYHNGACGFAFADSHSEFTAGRVPVLKGSGARASMQDRNDWLWMRERTSANSSGTLPPPR